MNPRACVIVAVAAWFAGASVAQSRTETTARDRMLVEAATMVTDRDSDTVSAVGDARVYYKGRVLEADKVVYDRRTKRLRATGHAKLTDKDGTVERGDTLDLTDDFRDGFVDSLRVDTPDKTHFSAPRMERVDDDATVFERATYTACDSCKDAPGRPPFWRVRAGRIVHRKEERTIYYEDAYLEFLGVPVAYVPYFSSADPTVTRKSGVLSPTTTYKTAIGFGVGLPVFFNLAPDYDLTLTPTAFTQQGFLGAGEFRQRLSNGSYDLKFAGIDERNPGLFLPGPYGAGSRALRGALQTKGDFAISSRWKFGWDVAALSDKYFLYDYSVPSDTLASNFYSESISTAFLTGQGDRSFFDLRGYRIQGLSVHDVQAEQANVRPVLDYDHSFDVDPERTRGLGGTVQFEFNLTSMSATSASFQSVGPRTLDSAFGLYDVCSTYAPGRTVGTSCLLRGLGGEYDRATAQVSYRRKYIDPVGQVWTPFAFARTNGQEVAALATGGQSFVNGSSVASIPNAAQSAFLGQQGLTGNVTPGAGVEYRYPLVARTSFGSLVLEPVAQVIARPSDVAGNASALNVDAQSLVFDDTNLFDWDKFSGYDRFETGTRANYGAQLSVQGGRGGSLNVQAGQSAQVAGRNGFAVPDAANVGLSSGLDTRRSDYVAGLSFTPASFLSLGASGRYDVDTFAPRRLDLVTTLNLGALTGAVQFAHYSQQPLIGYEVGREGLSLSGKYRLAQSYFAQGNVTFDMSRHLYPSYLTMGADPGLFAIATLGIGGGYSDECTTFAVNYSSAHQDNGVGSQTSNRTVTLSLQLRTLGETKFSKGSSSASTAPAIDNVR